MGSAEGQQEQRVKLEDRPCSAACPSWVGACWQPWMLGTCLGCLSIKSASEDVVGREATRGQDSILVGGASLFLKWLTQARPRRCRQ